MKRERAGYVAAHPLQKSDKRRIIFTIRHAGVTCGCKEVQPCRLAFRLTPHFAFPRLDLRGIPSTIAVFTDEMLNRFGFLRKHHTSLQDQQYGEDESRCLHFSSIYVYDLFLL